MMKKLFAFLFALPALLWLASCDVHQWPEEEPTPDPGNKFITLNLRYQPDFYAWEHLYDPMLGSVEECYPDDTTYPEYPGATRKYANVPDDGMAEIHVKVFDKELNLVTEEKFNREIKGNYDGSVSLQIPEAYGEEYTVVAWSHLRHPQSSKLFYDSSNFNRIQIIEENYAGNTDYRDGFSGRVKVNADPMSRAEEYTVDMCRPMGKFELITTDLSEFLDRETSRRGLLSRADPKDYRVIISFPMYYPNSYSAMEDRLEYSIQGVSFTTEMTVTGVTDASLGFEYVMLNDVPRGGVQMRVDVYSLDDGAHVAGSSTITVPMRRNNHSILRGAFLSQENGGGIGIDPSFSGDHNVIW